MMNPAHLARIDLNLLVLFATVYEERHVGRAAQRLHLTPSAISHALGRLRKTLNDPLFLRTPKGVAPTARAAELAQPVSEILAQVRGVIDRAQPFDPATSTRGITIAVPDGTVEVLLIPLLAHLTHLAPGIRLSVLQLLPRVSGLTAAEAWRPALEDLERGLFDIALMPIKSVPRRFEARALYQEEFVVAMRRGHDYAKRPSLKSYCEMRHLLVSRTGDTRGFIDALLEQKGLSRHVSVTVPGFLLALSILAETDLIASVPRGLLERHAERFGLVSKPLPFARARDSIRAVVTRAAIVDPGIAFVVDALARFSPN